MECAGTGGARLSPAVISQPWLVEAVGTASWTEGASLLRCDLLHHLQAVGFAPALDDPAVGDPHYVDAGEGDLSLGCRYAQLVSLVGAGCCPSHGHLVARGDDVITPQGEVGKHGMVEGDRLFDSC